LQKFLTEIPQNSQLPTGVWKLFGEDRRPPGRLEGMLKLAVTLLFVFALGAALSDLARGRRPLLLG
jgi:hypothetical protein